MKKTMFLFSVFISLSFCKKQGVSLDPNDELIGINGKYQGTYNDSVFEIWIEEASPVLKNSFFPHFSSESFFILIFHQSKAEEVQQFLLDYQDIQTYSNNVCQNVEKNNHEELYRALVGMNQIWGSHAGLGLMTADLGSTSTADIKTMFYINLAPNDEHALKALSVNAGRAGEIYFLETGFIKKLWNYFLSGPSMHLEKISSSTTGLLNTFYENYNKIGEDFDQAHQNNHSYCD